MRAVIQRVRSASITIAEQVFATINQGVLVLLGIEDSDGADDIEWLGSKIAPLRIFDDDSGIMNRSARDTGGGVLIVSQFTLHASTKKGNRPSYARATKPEKAIPLYESFVSRMSELIGQPVATGRFGADMQVALVNDGPVTILIDTKNRE